MSIWFFASLTFLPVYTIVLLSYAYYTPYPGDQCTSNLLYFLNHSVERQQNVMYVFNVIGMTPVPVELLNASMQFDNVRIRSSENRGSDLCVHADVLHEQHMSHDDTFVALNCGARGPFQRNSSRKLD
jgi:hypothetical protein